ncbi:MAG: CbtA family protein [Nitrososphaeraceae archaeon]
MDSLAFLVVALISGAIAGTFLGLVNLVAVEPYLDEAIGIEVQNAIADGEEVNTDEIVDYRIWQKGGQIAAGTILGMSFGALLGIVFVFARNKVIVSTNNSDLKNVILIAVILWLVLFLIPAIKYPANPPTVGDPTTIYERQTLYISFILMSGFVALGSSIIFKKIDAKLPLKFLVVSIIYGVVMTVLFVTMPSNPDEITAPADLVNGFRMASMATMTMFWIILGITFGVMWDKIKPHRQSHEFTTI